LSLCAIGKAVCCMQQIGKNRDDLLHLACLGYLNCALGQRSFLPNKSLTAKRLFPDVVENPTP
jgi:hypothetical protein